MVFDIIAVLFLSLAISIVGKILSYLKVRPTEYCAYWYLASHEKRLHTLGLDGLGKNKQGLADFCNIFIGS